LHDIPPSRLFEEMLKLFQGGCAVQTFELLRHYGLFAAMFPFTEECLAHEPDCYPSIVLIKALENTDARIQSDKSVTPAFLFAALLWEPMRKLMAALVADEVAEIQALQEAASQILSDQALYVALPKRFALRTRDIWQLQPRLQRNNGKRALQLLTNPGFRAAYDFLLVRNNAGEELGALTDWWTRIQDVDEQERVKMCGPVRKGKRRGRRRKVAKKA